MRTDVRISALKNGGGMRDTRLKHNPDLIVVEFDQFGNQAGHASLLSVLQRRIVMK